MPASHPQRAVRSWLGTRSAGGGGIGKRFRSFRERPRGGPLTRAGVIAIEASDTRVGTGSLPIFTGRKLMLVSGRANPVLARAIGHDLGIELGHITLKTFSGGEVYCRFEESVRGAEVFIVQPTCANSETGISANDAMMELLVMIDAAVGASAHRVVAVMPWYGYSRQDKKSALREPITARLVAQLLETAGIDRMLTIDLHAGQVQGFFRKPVDHMTALLLIADYFRGLELDDLVVVAPDVGRVKLNHKFAEMIGADLALMTKERPAQQVAEVGYVIGDVRGKTAVILDDIIDTAGTLIAAGQTALDEGAARVFAACTHPVFSGRAYERVANSAFEQVVVTDTIPLRDGAPDNLVVLSCASLLADTIRQIFTAGSVSQIFGGENQLF
jgi:ribose-phosphate pyrophosphokinase